MTNKKSPPAETKGLVSSSKYLNTTSSLHSIQQISALLTDKVDILIGTLFPKLPCFRRGNEIRINNKGSLCITIQPDGLVYFCHESQQGGNVFALIQYALALRDFKSSLSWAKSFLGLTAGQAIQQPVWQPAKKIYKPKCNKERVNAALFLWNKSQHVTDTYAEIYLRNRGITIALPDDLRFNSGIKNPSTGNYHLSLVAAVRDVNGKFTAMHYISLNPFTCQKIEGSSVNAKISKGVIKGGAVRLSADDCEVVACEGIEDGLSILQLNPSLCVWVGLGGNIRNIEFPPEVTKVTIAADNDEAGKANALKLQERLEKEGRTVSLIYPPEDFKDFNAYLMGSK